jgi:hypothetical protein
MTSLQRSGVIAMPALTTSNRFALMPDAQLAEDLLVQRRRLADELVALLEPVRLLTGEANGDVALLLDLVEGVLLRLTGTGLGARARGQQAGHGEQPATDRGGAKERTTRPPTVVRHGPQPPQASDPAATRCRVEVRAWRAGWRPGVRA